MYEACFNFGACHTPQPSALCCPAAVPLTADLASALFPSAMHAGELSAACCTWAAASPHDGMTSSYLRAPFPWVTKCQIEGEENSLMLPITLNSKSYIGDADHPRAGPGDTRDKRAVFLGSDTGEGLGRCAQTGRGPGLAGIHAGGLTGVLTSTCYFGDTDHPRARQIDMQDKCAVYPCLEFERALDREGLQSQTCTGSRSAQPDFGTLTVDTKHQG